MLWLGILYSREVVELVKVVAGLCMWQALQDFFVARIRTEQMVLG